MIISRMPFFLTRTVCRRCKITSMYQRHHLYDTRLETLQFISNKASDITQQTTNEKMGDDTQKSSLLMDSSKRNIASQTMLRFVKYHEGRIIKCISDNQTKPDSAVIIYNPGYIKLLRFFIKNGTDRSKMVCVFNDKTLESVYKESIMWKKDENIKTVCWPTRRKRDGGIGSVTIRKVHDTETEWLHQIHNNVQDLNITCVQAFGFDDNFASAAKILSNMISGFLYNRGYLQAGHAEFFYFMTSGIAYNFCKTKHYKTFNSHFWIFYDVELVRLLKAGNFQCKIQEKQLYNKHVMVGPITIKKPDDVFLLKITPKYDVLREFNQSQIQTLMTFCKFMWTKEKGDEEQLISKLEVVFPGCGPSLIAAGFKQDVTTKQLEPERYLDLYKVLTSLPGYEESWLQNIVSSPWN